MVQGNKKSRNLKACQAFEATVRVAGLIEGMKEFCDLEWRPFFIRSELFYLFPGPEFSGLAMMEIPHLALKSRPPNPPVAGRRENATLIAP
jgi:hypothetical protein